MSKRDATRRGAQSIPSGERQRPIRVVIVDDHPLVRQSVRFALLSAPDLETVGEAGDGEEALRLCSAVHPDMVLLDLRLPGLSSSETIRVLQQHPPVPEVLIYTADYDERLVGEALAEGAAGWVLKHGPAEELFTAIRAAHARHQTQA